MKAVDNGLLICHDDSGRWPGVVGECSQELFWRAVVWASYDLADVCHRADCDEALGIW